MKTKLILPVSAVLLLTMACTSSYHTKKGVYNYDLLRYEKASEHFEKATDKKNPHPSAKNYLIKSYVNLRDYNKIADYLKNNPEIVISNEDLAVEYCKSLVLTSEDSIPLQELNAVKNQYPENNTITKIVERAEDSSLYVSGKNYEIFPLKFDDLNETFSPFKYGEKFYFTAQTSTDKTKNTWDGQSHAAIYSTDADLLSDTSNVIASKKMDRLSNKFNVGTLIVDTIRNNFLFSANQAVPKNFFFQKNQTVDLNMAIFSADIKNDEEPKPLNFINKAYSYMHPSLSNDGKLLYFSSDLPGGFGGFDIYYSEFSDTGWTEPRNAGSKINTAGDEVFPFYVDHNLFFSSDKHNGLGGLDVFVTDVLQPGVFDEPENMKYPINSRNDDFGVYVSDSINSGLFSSNRSGNDKIYAFNTIPEKVTKDTLILDSVITMEHEKPLIFANLYIKLKETGEPVPNAVIVMNDKAFLQTDKEGFFKVQVEAETHYSFSVEQEGYYKTRTEIETPPAIGKDTIFVEKTIYLDKIVVEKVIVLEDIYYDYNKWDIRPDAAVELDRLVQLLNDNPSVEIELSSHTDSRGNDSYNMTLSKRRAESAVEYIISQGIDSNRIVANYYGETKLLNHCENGVQCPPELHQQNRRTEIKVTKINEDNTRIVYSSKYFDHLAEIAEQSLKTDNPEIIENSSADFAENDKGDKMWHIIAGSFKHMENANTFADQMRDKGYTDIKMLKEPSGKFHRVSICSFSKLAMAVKSIKEVKAETGDDTLWLLFE
ncbi:MAG: OmpA family protein [Bacteroidota bacterium]